jgi:hypothetical protein
MDTKVLMIHPVPNLTQVETVTIRLPSRTLFLPQLKEAFYKFAISKRRDLGWNDRNRIRAYHKSHNLEYPYCFVSYKYDETAKYDMRNLERWSAEHAPDIMSNTTNEPIVGPVFILEYEKSNSVTHCFTFKDVLPLKINVPKVAVAPQSKVVKDRTQPRALPNVLEEEEEEGEEPEELITFQGTSLAELAELANNENWHGSEGKYIHLSRYLRAIFIAASQKMLNIATNREGNRLAVNINLKSGDQYLYAICFKKINFWIIYKFVTAREAEEFDNCRNQPEPVRVLANFVKDRKVNFALTDIFDRMKKDGVLPTRWNGIFKFKKEEMDWFLRGMTMSIQERIGDAVPGLCPHDDSVAVKFFVPLIDNLVASLDIEGDTYVCKNIYSAEHVYGYCRVLGATPPWLKHAAKVQ